MLIRRTKGKSLLGRIRKVAFAAAIYHSWRARNEALFAGKTANVNDILHKIASTVTIQFSCIENMPNDVRSILFKLQNLGRLA